MAKRARPRSGPRAATSRSLMPVPSHAVPGAGAAPRPHHATAGGTGMHVSIWLLTGFAVGWGAGLFARERKFGLLGDLVLGCLGGVTGGWLLELLAEPPPAAAVHGLAAAAGAAAALGATGVLFAASRRAAARAPAVARAVRRAVRGESLAIDSVAEFERQMTFGERMADLMAAFGGSWPFVGIFVIAMLVWMAWNLERPQPF